MSGKKEWLVVAAYDMCGYRRGDILSQHSTPALAEKALIRHAYAQYLISQHSTPERADKALMIRHAYAQLLTIQHRADWELCRSIW